MKWPNPQQLFAEFNDREHAIFKYAARGFSNDTIADLLGVSVSTVFNYRTKIMKKTGFDNDVEMAHYALHHGLVPNNFDGSQLGAQQ